MNAYKQIVACMQLGGAAHEYRDGGRGSGDAYIGGGARPHGAAAERA